MTGTGRPRLGARLRYAFGFALPQHLDWVRHDLTDPGWRWRAMGRLAIQVSPFVVVIALLPIDPQLRIYMVAFIVLTTAFLAAAYADVWRDRRLAQHGLDRQRR